MLFKHKLTPYSPIFVIAKLTYFFRRTVCALNAIMQHDMQRLLLQGLRPTKIYGLYKTSHFRLPKRFMLSTPVGIMVGRRLTLRHHLRLFLGKIPRLELRLSLAFNSIFFQAAFCMFLIIQQLTLRFHQRFCEFQ